MKRQLLILSTAIALFSSCIGPKKINKWITDQYGETVTSSAKPKNDYLTVTSGLITNDTKPSNTVKQTKGLLPLVFYWQFDYLNTSTLNPQIPVNTFTSTAKTYANSKGLKQKLNGQKIELSIDQMPNVFVLNDRAHMVWLVYGFGWDNVTFQPDRKEMIVSYKILKDNTETRKGVVTISNTDKILQLKYLHSIKKATGEYLNQYDENIRSMSKKVVDQILSEI